MCTGVDALVVNMWHAAHVAVMQSISLTQWAVAARHGVGSFCARALADLLDELFTGGRISGIVRDILGTYVDRRLPPSAVHWILDDAGHGLTEEERQDLLRSLPGTRPSVTVRQAVQSHIQSAQCPPTERLRLQGRIMVIPLRERVCLLYTSPSPRDGLLSRMPSSA